MREQIDGDDISLEEKIEHCCDLMIAFLEENVRSERLPSGKVVEGWHQKIGDDDIVGTVATAQILSVVQGLQRCFRTVDAVGRILPSVLALRERCGGWAYKTNANEAVATEPTAFALIALMAYYKHLTPEDRRITEELLLGMKRFQSPGSALYGIAQQAEPRIYFSCLSLQCYIKALDVPALSAGGWAEKVDLLIEGLFACCRDGWGARPGDPPTVFHTSFVLCTLAQVAKERWERHRFSCGRALSFLEASAYLDSGAVEECAFPAQKRIRVTLNHSTELYAAMALLLWGNGKLPLQTIARHTVNRICMRVEEQGCWDHPNLGLRSWAICDALQLLDLWRTHGVHQHEEERKVSMKKRFKIALSFAGEYRKSVEVIADILAKRYGQKSILYDFYHKAEFARPNLVTHLQNLYFNESELNVVFLSNAYHSKTWTGVEWRAILSRMTAGDTETLMFIKCEEFYVAGVFENLDGYLDLRVNTPQDIAAAIIERYGMLP